MDKKSLFDEFKKNKQKQAEATQQEVSEELDKFEEELDTDEVEEAVEVQDDAKIEEATEVKDEVLETEMPNIIYSNPKFKEFKAEFLKEEKNKTLITFFDQMREDGAKIFENDFFIYQKMIDKHLKVILLEPSVDDIALGKKNRFFLVRPIYPNEYQSFITQFQSKEKYPDEYMKFIIETGVVYPTDIQEPYNLAYTSGEALTLFDTIINISDLNKRYRVIEV